MIEVLEEFAELQNAYQIAVGRDFKRAFTLLRAKRINRTCLECKYPVRYGSSKYCSDRCARDAHNRQTNACKKRKKQCKQ